MYRNYRLTWFVLGKGEWEMATSNIFDTGIKYCFIIEFFYG